MTKQQSLQVDLIHVYMANNMVDTAAQSLSALIRCAMTTKSKKELMALAVELNLINNPEFIA